MPDFVPPNTAWTPRVRDTQAQQADHARLSLLRRATAQAVEPMLRARFAQLDASGLADNFLDQAETLRHFLLNEGQLTAASAEGIATRDELRQQLAQFLQTRVPPKNAAAADKALASQMAAEFAGNLWATVLSWLRRHHGAQDAVDVALLLPDQLQTEQTSLTRQIAADARHFGLSNEEINLVMADTLDALLKADLADPDYLCWPAGLRVPRDALAVRVRLAQATRRHTLEEMAAAAVHMDYAALAAQLAR